jgi:hypothetical protein
MKANAFKLLWSMELLCKAESGNTRLFHICQLAIDMEAVAMLCRGVFG